MKQLVEKDFKFEDLKVGMEVCNSISGKWLKVLKINEDETNDYPISTSDYRSFTKDGKEHIQSYIKLTKMRYEEEAKLKQLVEIQFSFEECKVGREVYNDKINKWQEVTEIDTNDNRYPIHTKIRSYSKDGEEYMNEGIVLTRIRYEEEVEFPGDTYRVDLCPTCNWLREDGFCGKREFHIRQNRTECEEYKRTEIIKEECEHTFNLAPISNLCSECDKREGAICTVNNEPVKPGEREFDCHDYKNKYNLKNEKKEDVQGSHYAVGGIETIDVLKQQITEEQFEGFLLGNILKYGLRCNHKGSKEQDLKKVLNYAHMLVEKKWFY